MSIHILPSEVASQIAAGEVIERPASVVKELLENSIDAGAKSIAIQIEDAGKRSIEVADDGCGIQAKELALAVERHATSKLENADDLFKIRTLGFRGEALASIGSVARLTITSRPQESEIGAILRVEGGAGATVRASGSPVGTVVRVENLFFNVPARLKFLKTDTTERRQIDNLVTRYALAYPDVRFQLKQDGKPALQTSGNGNRREVLAAMYGVDIARQMLEVLAEEEGLRIKGFISPTSLTRSNRREIVFFVNGRPVQDVALVAALIKAYHTLLMVGRYPLGILFLDTPAEAVDVNVHPTKAEVRFRDPNRVFSGVQAAVRRALLAHTPVPRLDHQLRWTPGPGWDTPAQIDHPDWQMAQEMNPQVAGDKYPIDNGADSAFQAAGANLSAQPGLPGARIPLLRLVGQLASAYLVAEGPDGLYLIDQHAAHERVLFERFMALRSSEIPSQILLQPVTVELPSASARLLEPQLPTLQHLGFDVEVFGSNTYLVRAIPSLLSGSEPAAALRVLVEDFEEDETPLREEVEARVIARVCKRAAVKAGHTLSPEEQKTLLADLEACQSPRTCPHGRPTMIHLSVDLLERQFGRRGAR
jgi:DNA mismatch repair protein MutL